MQDDGEVLPLRRGRSGPLCRVRWKTGMHWRLVDVSTGQSSSLLSGSHPSDSASPRSSACASIRAHTANIEYRPPGNVAVVIATTTADRLTVVHPYVTQRILRPLDVSHPPRPASSDGPPSSAWCRSAVHGYDQRNKDIIGWVKGVGPLSWSIRSVSRRVVQGESKLESRLWQEKRRGSYAQHSFAITLRSCVATTSSIHRAPSILSPLPSKIACSVISLYINIKCCQKAPLVFESKRKENR